MQPVEQDIPSPRKRRKIEKELSKSCYLSGQGIGNKTIEGVGPPLPRQSLRRNEIHIKSINQRRIENNISTSRLSSDGKANRSPSQIHGPAMVLIDPHSTNSFVSRQADINQPQSTRPRDNQQKGGAAVGKPDEWTYHPAWNLQKPPRVHVRSSSAFPESVGIRTNKNAYSAAAQFDRRRRVNSQPASMNAPRDVPLHSIAQDLWDPEDFTAEHSGERVPLLRSIQTQSLAGLGTDDGVNEVRQHIGRHKNLWFVAVAILVGIFLCLFLYAFNIIN